MKYVFKYRPHEVTEKETKEGFKECCIRDEGETVEVREGERGRWDRDI